METTHPVDEVHSTQPLGGGPTAPLNPGDVTAAWGEFADACSALVRECREYLAHTTAAHPETALACAAGLGFVVGGGLTSVTGRLLLRGATRMALARAVQPLLEARAPVPDEFSSRERQ